MDRLISKYSSVWISILIEWTSRDWQALCVSKWPCQAQTWNLSKFLHDHSFGPKMLYTKNAYIWTIFTHNKTELIMNISNLVLFVFKLIWMYKILTVSERVTLGVWNTKYIGVFYNSTPKMCYFFNKKLHSWHEFYVKNFK